MVEFPKTIWLKEERYSSGWAVHNDAKSACGYKDMSAVGIYELKRIVTLKTVECIEETAYMPPAEPAAFEEAMV